LFCFVLFCLPCAVLPASLVMLQQPSTERITCRTVIRVGGVFFPINLTHYCSTTQESNHSAPIITITRTLLFNNPRKQSPRPHHPHHKHPSTPTNKSQGSIYNTYTAAPSSSRLFSSGPWANDGKFSFKPRGNALEPLPLTPSTPCCESRVYCKNAF
jgi:hypothetical protein